VVLGARSVCADRTAQHRKHSQDRPHNPQTPPNVDEDQVTETSSTSAMPKPDRGTGNRRPERRKSPVARLGLFYRQVIAELRKVVWPTRNELVTYTTVVIVFVGIIVAIVATLDYGFSKLVTWVFG
jgi:preprotein translocase subunit SecE